MAIAFRKGDTDLHLHAFKSCSFAVLVRAVDCQEAWRPVPAGVPYTLLQDLSVDGATIVDISGWQLGRLATLLWWQWTLLVCWI